jgi:8-oxo-dGTP pyrophosphatase MutT (NUDIX family)
MMTAEEKNNDDTNERQVPVHSFVRKLAAATVVICRVPKSKNNNNNKLSYDYFVLLTQRQSYMRTFPSFFVLPGGSFDYADSTVENCARRELFEEVSLQLVTTSSNNISSSTNPKDESEDHQHQRSPSTNSSSSSSASSFTSIEDGKWTFEGVWESSYCTHPDADEVVDATCTVRGHIVFFFSVLIEVPTVEELPRLKAQSEEVASCKWYRCGSEVDAMVKDLMKKTSNNNAEENGDCVVVDFGPSPKITDYFEEMNIDPQKMELTLQLEDDLYGSKTRKEKDHVVVKNNKIVEEVETAVNKSTNNNNIGRRMKITAGSEYFIMRALERMIAQEENNNKRIKQI